MFNTFYVYMLLCSDRSYYTGHTDNVESRMASHQRGEILGYTRNRRPVKLVFLQEFTSRDEAFRAERQIKDWSRAKKEALIRGDWQALQALAEAYFRRKHA